MELSEPKEARWPQTFPVAESWIRKKSVNWNEHPTWIYRSVLWFKGTFEASVTEIVFEEVGIADDWVIWKKNAASVDSGSKSNFVKSQHWPPVGQQMMEDLFSRAGGTPKKMYQIMIYFI
jgi:hypothetical protein